MKMEPNVRYQIVSNPLKEKKKGKKEDRKDPLLLILSFLLNLESLERSKQSAALGLPIEGASLPTSLQKFQASKPTRRPSLLIPGSPTAEPFFAKETQEGNSKFAMKNKIKGKYSMAGAVFLPLGSRESRVVIVGETNRDSGKWVGACR